MAQQPWKIQRYQQKVTTNKRNRIVSLNSHTVSVITNGQIDRITGQIVRAKLRDLKGRWQKDQRNLLFFTGICLASR